MEHGCVSVCAKKYASKTKIQGFVNITKYDKKGQVPKRRGDHMQKEHNM